MKHEVKVAVLVDIRDVATVSNLGLARSEP